MLNENATLEEIQHEFTKDHFATSAGCRVLEGSRGHSKCYLDITEQHRNVVGAVMGGALFTLADFALAVACNIGEAPTVSINHSISFMRSTKGTRLYAEARLEKPGQHVAFYNIDITDDQGKLISQMSATCYRLTERSAE